MTPRNLPRVLWIALVSLALIILIQVSIVITRDEPAKLRGPAISLAMLVGLYLGHRWAYVLAVIGCIGMPITVAMEKGYALALTTLTLNCLLILLPVLMSHDYFWRRGRGRTLSDRTITRA